MPEIGFKFVPKEFFFDRQKVIAAVERGKRQALSKAGAFVRTRARSMLNKSPGKKARAAGNTTAPAGKAPFKHAGDLRRLMYFAYSPESGSVVIGPSRFKAGIVPELMEFGGTETLTNRRGKKRTAHYRGNHKFMGPSLAAEVEAGTIAKAWAGVVKN
jgi:hypothetical protein